MVFTGIRKKRYKRVLLLKPWLFRKDNSIRDNARLLLRKPWQIYYTTTIPANV
jgi:hypothetical protein